MNKNLVKRPAEGGAEDPQWKQPHVSEGPNSRDDGFVLADFVRDVHSARRKDCFPSENEPKHPCDDGDDDEDADSDGEVDVVPKNLLCPGPAVCLGRVDAMVENMDYAAMAQMDFCQLVVDELHVAAVKWHTDVMHTLTPYSSFLTNKDLMKLYNEDIVFKGKIYLETYRFGRLLPGVAACDVHEDSSNRCEKDEDLADVSSPLDVVVDKV
ncbi:hypothetical protein ZWY2020_024545 [Hordeum vulgare]|nr:hypothetical protein ZWY2020_024545 [Hordeum vulgare]